MAFKNLNNYTQLSNLDISTSLLGNIRVTQPDSGIATSNLPSSDTSVGRFIRAVFYSTYAPKVDNAKDAMITLAHIMNNFDRTKNMTVDNMGKEKALKIVYFLNILFGAAYLIYLMV